MPIVVVYSEANTALIPSVLAAGILIATLIGMLKFNFCIYTLLSELYACILTMIIVIIATIAGILYYRKGIAIFIFLYYSNNCESFQLCMCKEV